MCQHRYQPLSARFDGHSREHLNVCGQQHGRGVLPPQACAWCEEVPAVERLKDM
jgi:hypothetical protein